MNLINILVQGRRAARFSPSLLFSENRQCSLSTLRPNFFPPSMSSQPNTPTTLTIETSYLSSNPMLNTPADSSFKLSAEFVSRYTNLKPPFGFNGLGELVFFRTYSRIRENEQRNEEWFETIERVVNGTFNVQKRWCLQQGLPWNETQSQDLAKKMYDKIFHMKFLPPGRGLWAMGSRITEERHLYAALNNCAFVSTSSVLNAENNPAKPFTFLMDAAMLGVGVGFDTAAAGLIQVYEPDKTQVSLFTVPDSREGWVTSLDRLLTSYLLPHQPFVQFNYLQIRPAGLPIKGFGGRSLGASPLRELHQRVTEVLVKNSGTSMTVTTVVDIMNLIGKCIASGNVRQTAEIAFGDYRNQEYIDLKNYTVNPHRQAYGWTSNNSVFCDLGMDYSDICKRIAVNGEPGFAWLQNAREFSRMNGIRDNKDERAQGGNPCLEQTLESYELCCLVETFPHRHDHLEEYLDTLKYAFLYAKTVTLTHTHWPESNAVMLKNRRIGCSLSGIAQFISHKGIDELKQWCEKGYDAIQQYDQQYSSTFGIPRSIKTTTVKPSGTVSLLAGATPGMHYPENRYCVRRIRMSRNSELLPALARAGYPMEPCVGNEETTVVVSFPIDVGEGLRPLHTLSMWEQLSLAAFLQRYWSDNQVSCTVTFDPERESEHLPMALQYFQYMLKGVSFLPRMPLGAYPQMPIEGISRETYEEMAGKIKKGGPLFHGQRAREPSPDKYCDTSACVIDPVQSCDDQ